MTRRGEIRIAAIVIVVALVFAVTRHNSRRHLGWRGARVGHTIAVVPTITTHDEPPPDVPAPKGVVPKVSTNVSVSTDTGAEASSDDKDNDDNDSADDNDDDNSPAAASAGHRGMRTVVTGRQIHAARDTAAPMHVKVVYGVGTLHVAPADAPWLYNVHMAYDQPDKEQTIRFDTASRTLAIGGGPDNDIHIGKRNDSDDSDLRVGLARGVPLDLRVEFGAGDAVLQLGGLSLSNLAVSTGASDATVRFDAPNPIVLDRLKFEVGAAGFKAVNLGNARAKTLIVEAGAGDVDLDFGGHWTNDVTLDLTAALGAVHVHVPRGVVLDQTGSKVVIGSTEDHTGGESGAGGPQTAGGPLYHLRVNGTATLGSINYDRQVVNP
ncbi:MAG: hypothetical protein ACHQTF_05030 [Gemmatimonadales bacterium]